MSRNTEFNKHFKEVLRRAKDKTNLICRAVALELLGDFERKSPVDTGRFKSNWNVSIGNIDTTQWEADNGSISRGQVVIKDFSAGQKIFITNSMPYAKPIEFGMYPNPPKGGEGKTTQGFSSQAPAGVVRISVAEYAQKLKAIVERLKNEST